MRVCVKTTLPMITRSLSLSISLSLSLSLSQSLTLNTVLFVLDDNQVTPVLVTHSVWRSFVSWLFLFCPRVLVDFFCVCVNALVGRVTSIRVTSTVVIRCARERVREVTLWCDYFLEFLTSGVVVFPQR